MNKIEVEVHEREPSNFQPKMEVAGCFIDIDESILLLQTGQGKPESGTWGVPGGKLELNETAESAARRELFEETGILIEYADQIQSAGVLYMRKCGVDFVFHLFGIFLSERPEIRLSEEHQNYKWANAEDLNVLPLMAGAKDALQIFRLF